MGIHEGRSSTDADTPRSPIAIVGIGCRFPGNVDGPKTFWQLLRDGRDAIGEIPPSRIDVASYYDPRPASPGKLTSRWGGFLDEIDMFDAAFFGISPREAERLDPQQRLLLEIAWEALEDAGQDIDRLSGSDAGVFVGMWLNDYEARLFADPRTVDFHMTTGTGRYSASGRLSYFLGIQGPSLTVDTACSSSLVAVHLACRSLWSGECSLALAGGANVILQPHISIAYSQAKMIAPDGRCKFGDASANGYVRSEGAGIVVLKPLAAALADGDPIYALIQGSAVNNDGSSSGYLTTPGRRGHEELLRKAYCDAMVSPGSVQYVEAHGTGTIAGDPVEVGALGTVLSASRVPGDVCYLGSVKTNFGHTEGAAGIAGLIKTALTLKHRMIPASLHLKEPNPAIPWSDYPFEIPRKLTAWPLGSERAIAGVSAFGIAGTNAHVVLSEAPRGGDSDETRATTSSACLLPISARSPEALASLVRAYRSMLEDTQAPPLSDVAFTAALRRSHHEYRLAAVSDSRSGMSDVLAAFLRGERVPGVWTGDVEADRSRKVVFVCPGQGSQWVGMGRQLMSQEPAFRQALCECEQAMRPFVDWSLDEQVKLDPKDPGYRLDEIDVIQPILVSIEIALAALWRSWGVIPDAIVGHSMGEVAAAFIAGALKLEDAMHIICARSRLLHTVRGKGAMAMVALPMREAERAVAKYRDRVSTAVSNSPRSTVISGDPSAIGNILEELQARNVFCRLVKVDVASHSPQMDSLADELFRSLGAIETRQEETPIYSTVTGNEINGAELDAGYWKRNLRSPVLFSKAVERLAEDGHTIFIELSPHPILLPSIEETLHDLGRECCAVPSCERDKDERPTMLSSLGRLYTVGFPVEWSRLFPIGGKVVALPSYPWQKQRFWMETSSQFVTGSGSSAAARVQSAQEHPLLGVGLPSVAALPASSIWQTTFSGQFREILLQGHGEDSAPISQSAYVEMASAAAKAVFGEKLYGLSELKTHEPIYLSESVETKIQFMLTQSGARQASFQVSSCAPGPASKWKPVASGKVEAVDAEADWLYELEWKQKPLPQDTLPASNGGGGRWLIFADRGGIGTALAAALRDAGEEYAVATVGDSFQIQSPNHFCVSPCASDIQRVLQEVFKPGCEFRGIVYLWGLDSEDALKGSYQLSCDGLLCLVQSLAQLKMERPPRIWLVTQGAQEAEAADGRSLTLQQTPLWGLGRVIALEQPDLFGGLVDLPAAEGQTMSLAESARRLCLEFLTSDGEDQVALRAQSRYALRLVRSQAAAIVKQKLLVHGDATYLITGGLGGLGIHLAQWLVGQGARHLVLTSRTGLPERSTWKGVDKDSELERRIAAVQALEQAGAEVLVAEADVADKSEMSELWEKLSRSGAPVRGIIHAAGVANPRSLLQTTPEQAREILRPKADGAWILHQLTLSRRESEPPLDFFVMFSSAAAQLGAQDLGVYAAANHFMDALSHYRAARGLPALCVNWGWWDSPGLVSERLAALFRGAGMNPLPPEQALATLTHLLEIGATQASVASVDWNVFRPLFDARKVRPLLEFITARPRGDSQAKTPSHESTPGFLKQIEAASSIEKRSILQEYIRAQVAEILGFKLSEGVALDQGFFRMGMDSMMTVQLRNRLELSLGCSLPPTVAFEYPTVDTLTNFLADKVIKLEHGGATPIANSPCEEFESDPDIEQDELSEEELVDLLSRKLEEMQ